MWNDLQRFKERFMSFLSHDIGIDLGTANTLVYLRGKGYVVNEPSVVAVNKKTGRVVAVGADAQRMRGRTPEHIEAIKPLVDGVISDFEIAEEMIAYLMRRAQGETHKLLGPRVVIGVPSGTTNVERRAVRDAAYNAGAREVHVIEEPMAAALGVRLPVKEPVGSMVIDIGGGSTDIAILSLGGIVNAKNINIAGDKFNNDIIAYIRDEFKVLIGEQTAEQLKITLSSALPIPGKSNELRVSGRDLVTGLPREIIVTDADVRAALRGSLETLSDTVKEVLETTQPETVADVMRRGIFLTGGGALIRGLDTFLAKALHVPVYVADDPLTCMVRGTGVVLEELDAFKDVMVDEEHALPPTA